MIQKPSALHPTTNTPRIRDVMLCVVIVADDHLKMMKNGEKECTDSGIWTLSLIKGINSPDVRNSGCERLV